MRTRIDLSLLTLLLVTCSRAEDSGDSGKMARVLDGMRERCIDFARRTFATETVIDAYLEIFRAQGA